MRKYIIMLTIIVSALVSTGAISYASEFQGVVYTNDVHGNSEFAEKFQKVENHLWIDGGDVLHGSDLAILSQGEAMIELLNKKGLDILVPGNHEFDYGTERLLELEKKFNGKMIASNVYYKNTNKRVFKPYIIENVQESKVLFIGLTTEEINSKVYAPMVADIEVRNPSKELELIISEVAEESYDEIVIVGHLGKKATDNLSKKDKASFVLDGHDHKLLYKDNYINNGFNGESVTLINLKSKKSKSIRLNEYLKENKITNKDSKLVSELSNKFIPELPSKTKITKVNEVMNLDKFSSDKDYDWKILYLLNKDKFNLSQKYQFIGGERGVDLIVY